jgi:hypothetical protein
MFPSTAIPSFIILNLTHKRNIFLALNFHRREPEDLTVLVGTVVLNDGGARHAAQLITMHPGYDPSNMFKDDIALVKVRAGLTEDRRVLGFTELIPESLSPHRFQ